MVLGLAGMGGEPSPGTSKESLGEDVGGSSLPTVSWESLRASDIGATGSSVFIAETWLGESSSVVIGVQGVLSLGVEEGRSLVWVGLSVTSTSLLHSSLDRAWPGLAAFLLIFFPLSGGACLCTLCWGVEERGDEDTEVGCREEDGDWVGL